MQVVGGLGQSGPVVTVIVSHMIFVGGNFVVVVQGAVVQMLDKKLVYDFVPHDY